MTELREWLSEVGELCADALISSGSIRSCVELFDAQLWDTSIVRGVAARPRAGRLTARSWRALTSTEDLHGLNIALEPRPHVPESAHHQSRISLHTFWYGSYPDRVSLLMPARFLSTVLPRAWEHRLIEAFKALGRQLQAETAYVGWMATPMSHMRYPPGTVDFTRTLIESGWAQLVRESHVELLGGPETLEASGLFASPELILDATWGKLYYLQSTCSLSEARDGLVAASERLELLRSVLVEP